MYNYVESEKKSNNNKTSLKSAATNIINSPIESKSNSPTNLNSKIKSGLKELSKSASKNSLSVFYKSPILMKEKSSFLQGHGLWCIDLQQKDQPYNRNDTLEILKSEIYSNKNTIENIIHEELDKKTIDILKFKVSDLVVKLEASLCKYYDAEHRAKRAENIKDDYFDIIKNKKLEVREMSETIDSLNDNIGDLSEALSNSKKEIDRLIKLHENYLVDFNSKNSDLEILKDKNEKLKIKNKELESHTEILNMKITELNKRLEYNQLSLDRVSNRNNHEKIENFTPKNNNPNNPTNNPTTPNPITNPTTNNFINNPIKNPINQNFNQNQRIMRNNLPLKDQSEEILKMQLQILDLRKKIDEDEKIKLNLFEVIKAKKLKYKDLTNEMNKMVNVFEEYMKDNRWSQDKVMQKENEIKVLKDKVKCLTDEVRKLCKDILKYQIARPTAEIGIEVNFPIENHFVQVKANPNLFY